MSTCCWLVIAETKMKIERERREREEEQPDRTGSDFAAYAWPISHSYHLPVEIQPRTTTMCCRVFAQCDYGWPARPVLEDEENGREDRGCKGAVAWRRMVRAGTSAGLYPDQFYRNTSPPLRLSTFECACVHIRVILSTRGARDPEIESVYGHNSLSLYLSLSLSLQHRVVDAHGEKSLREFSRQYRAGSFNHWSYFEILFCLWNYLCERITDVRHFVINIWQFYFYAPQIVLLFK